METQWPFRLTASPVRPKGARVSRFFAFTTGRRGKRMWWPSALAHSDAGEPPQGGGEPEAVAVAGESG
jgi:hypothetical protein